MIEQKLETNKEECRKEECRSIGNFIRPETIINNNIRYINAYLCISYTLHLLLINTKASFKITSCI